MNTIIDWLMEDNNPAVRYRTSTELLNEKATKSQVVDWVINFLPYDWQDAKGLWFQY